MKRIVLGLILGLLLADCAAPTAPSVERLPVNCAAVCHTRGMPPNP